MAKGVVVTEKGFRERAQETARTGREPQWQKKSRVLRKGLQGQGKGTLHSDRNRPLTGARDRPIAMKKSVPLREGTFPAKGREKEFRNDKRNGAMALLGSLRRSCSFLRKAQKMPETARPYGGEILWRKVFR